MHSFELHIPTKIFFGRDKADAFADELARLGSRILVVTGGGSVERLGYFTQVMDQLKRRGIESTVFRGIEPNPHSQTINRAAESGKQAGVQAVLGFGGGSVMDAAKAIAALIHDEEEEIWEYVTGSPRHGKLKGAIPIATIPTTAATASEVSAAAVISNPEVKGKAPISYSFLRPTASWLNPHFHTTLPLQTTRDGAADILSHVFENYLLGGNDSPPADRYSEGIIDTVVRTLPLIEKDPGNPVLRGQMLWTSTLALNGMQQVGRKRTPFIMHNMEHALSGYNPDLSHGRGLATLYPAWFSWLVEKERATDRIALMGRRVFGVRTGTLREEAHACIKQLGNWLKENGLWQSLSDVGIPREAFGEIADYAIRTYGNGEPLNAAGPLTRDEIVRIFEATEHQRTHAEEGSRIREDA